MPKVSKILFVTLSNIGDCILTLPVLDCLRKDFPEAEITVIVGPRPALIFQESRNANKVFIYDKRAGLGAKINILKSLRKNKFDLVVDLRNSIFSWLVPARRKNPNLLRFPSSLKHMRQRHLFKLSGLGLKRECAKVEAKSFKPEGSGLASYSQTHKPEGSGLASYSQTHKPEGNGLASYSQTQLVRLQDEEYISQILKKAGIIDKDRIMVISPGARSLIKRWPKEKFTDLVNSLPAGFKIILIGDQNDAPINQYINRNAKVAVLDLTGRTSLLQAAALLKKATLLITNDSANLHLASYLNVPTVAIFGPTDDTKYGPWSENWRVVKKEIFCRPCRKAQCRFKTMECLHRVSVEDVLRQVKEMLVPSSPACPSCLPAGRRQYKRILIVRTDRMGDVILSTPVIKALRDAYPQAYLAMVVRPYTKVIVENNPNLDEAIIYDKDYKEKNWFAAFGFSRTLAKNKFDLAIVLNPSNRSNLIPFLAGIPKRIGYGRKLGFLLTDRVKDLKYQGKKHEIEYNLDLVRALGIEPRDKNTFMPISSESEIWVEEVFKKENIFPSDKLVVINPAASDNSKMWAQERYAQVADKLSDKGLKIIILGGPKDQEIAGGVIKNLHCQYINMVGNNNISQAASLLRRSSLFISSDTGPMHLASSLGTPVIAILGRSQPGLSPLRWGPHNKKSAVIHKDVGCLECLAHNCRKGFLCLEAITVDDVIKAAEKLISF